MLQKFCSGDGRHTWLLGGAGCWAERAAAESAVRLRVKQLLRQREVGVLRRGCGWRGRGGGSSAAGGALLSSATCAAVTGQACSAAGVAGDKRTSWYCSRPPAPLPLEAKPASRAPPSPTLRNFNNNGHNYPRVYWGPLAIAKYYVNVRHP